MRHLGALTDEAVTIAMVNPVTLNVVVLTVYIYTGAVEEAETGLFYMTAECENFYRM